MERDSSLEFSQNIYGSAFLVRQLSGSLLEYKKRPEPTLMSYEVKQVRAGAFTQHLRQDSDSLPNHYERCAQDQDHRCFFAPVLMSSRWDVGRSPRFLSRFGGPTFRTHRCAPVTQWHSGELIQCGSIICTRQILAGSVDRAGLLKGATRRTLLKISRCLFGATREGYLALSWRQDITVGNIEIVCWGGFLG